MGVCKGDSGGPVMWLNKNTNKFTLIGEKYINITLKMKTIVNIL